MSVRKILNPKVLFIGFGNVGNKIAELLLSKNEIHPGIKNFKPKIVGIFTKSHGAVVSQQGINLEKSYNQFISNKIFTASSPDYTNIPVIEAIQSLDYDCLIDISTLTIKSDGEPSISYTRKALKRGINVISANKGPAAFANSELHLLAAKHNCKFLHESAVMDGAPVFNLFRENLRGCKVTGLSGILNSTTNFILSKMEDEYSFEKSLKKRRNLVLLRMTT